jgi:uncharacterized membrane protein/mono/diheme cytochrome c family protein
MKWWAISAAFFATAGVSAADTGRDIGAEARAVFAGKCAGCHGPDLAKPKGRFGYVLDLRRVAGNPEMVIPSRPEESELWQLVERGEMPPDEAPNGPLSTAEKETIRAWIAAGAHPDSSPPAEAASTLKGTERAVRWLGKFHLLAIHFPIALVIAAGVGELRSIFRRELNPSDVVRFCLWFAALAAVPTAASGWLHAAAGNGAGSPQLLMTHRWLGTAAAVWLVVTAVLSERDARRCARSRATRLMLVSGVVLTVLTAHLGGLLDHGPNFLDW